MSAEFVPEGPAESPRVRKFAESSLYGMPVSALTDKAQFLASMKDLDNRILGIQSKEQKYASSMGKKPLSAMTAASSSMYKANSGSGHVPMTISPDMRVASLSSLEKIKNLRHNVTISLDNNTVYGGGGGGEASVPPDAPSSASAFKYTEYADSTDFSVPAASMTSKAPVKTSSGELKTTGSAFNAADVSVSTGESAMSKGKFMSPKEGGGSRCGSVSSSKEFGGGGFAATTGAGEGNKENVGLPVCEGSTAGASSSSAITSAAAPLSIEESVDLSSQKDTQPAKALYSPKFNEKGELDFSGSFKAQEPLPVKAEFKKPANLEESAASVWLVQPDVKKSLDLSGLSLDELKDLQGHY